MKELSEVLKDWEAVIGLEIRTELDARRPRCSAVASSAMTTRRIRTYVPYASACPARCPCPTAVPSKAS